MYSTICTLRSLRLLESNLMIRQRRFTVFTVRLLDYYFMDTSDMSPQYYHFSNIQFLSFFLHVPSMAATQQHLCQHASPEHMLVPKQALMWTYKYLESLCAILILIVLNVSPPSDSLLNTRFLFHFLHPCYLLFMEHKCIWRCGLESVWK